MWGGIPEGCPIKPMNDKKLFLLDAYALIYRAYYALIRAPRITSKGFNTSAIFGFCNTLHEILQKENPTHIAVCFDPKGGTFRHELYAEYKAKREAQPEDITLSLPVIKEIVDAYRIPVFEIPGFEADDVIGTLSRMATAQGFTTYMMTPDKDYGQLVTDKVFMYRPSLKGTGFEIRGVKEICEKYGIQSPSQVVDLLALEGDAIDNIPGCPGVGPKTATKLIAEFGSVDKMLENADTIKGALGERIRANADNIRFSRQLATIRTDVPMDVDFDTLVREPEDTERLREIFTRMEFKSFLPRLKGGDKAPATTQPVGEMLSLFDFVEGEQQTTSDLPETEYSEIDSESSLKTETGTWLKAGTVGIALYAPGAEAMTAPLTAIAISTREGHARMIRLPGDPVQRERTMEALRPLFTDPSVTLVSHDIKRDMVLLRREGIEISASYADISLSHYVLQPEMRHRLADIALSVINYHTSDYDADATPRKPFAPIPPEELTRKLCEQADITLRLHAPLQALLKENGQLALVNDIELPLARVLADMEWTGVRIDTGELNTLSVQLTIREKEIEEQIYELAGERFNIASPMQVGEILFGKLQLDPKAKRTKKGGYSTTEEILEKHRSRHPIVGLILAARSLRKLLTTYVNALPELVNPATGKVHTTYNQTVTATGRISSTNPNLQNIPIRTDDGREVRRAFIADPGCVVLSADYSQIELRLLASLSEDPQLIEAFREGLDIHRATAAKLYHVPYDEVTDTQRRNAKTANFGTVYGISAFGLSERLGIPRVEAKALIDGYFQTYPHLREFIEQSTERARQQGFVSTIMGRKRYLPDINSRNATVRSYAERNAVNAPLQGSAADIIKIAMIRIFNELNACGMRSKMVMQVHDELIFNAPLEEVPQLQEMVTRLMEGAFDGAVPLEVSSGTGANWLEAH